MSYLEITISNNIVEIKEYEKLNIKNDMEKARETEKGEGSYSIENYQRRMKIRKRKLRQIINTNFNTKSKFITLTFKDNNDFNVKDVKECNQQFKKFIKRLNYHMQEKVVYVAVIEFQDKNKRGAVHYHMLANMDYLPFKQLKSIWGLGGVFINKINDVDNIGAYVVKYMNKEMDDIRLKGLKAYNMSTGLKKPIVIKSWENEELTKRIYDKYTKDKEKLVYDKRYQNEHSGQIIYQQYNYTRK